MLSGIQDNNQDATQKLEAMHQCKSGTAKAGTFSMSMSASPSELLPYSSPGQCTIQSCFASSETELTMQIADLIYSEGLPFNLTEKARFQNVIRLAKAVPASYKLPHQNALSGELLDLSFHQYKANAMTKVLREADKFGISFFGDGATIKKMPLVNILCSGVHSPATVLEIADCTTALAQGGKKDAKYLADLFFPHLADVDPKKDLTDLVLFDGATNVQKAGEVIQARYPRVTVLRGAEHVVSLFFKDVAKIKAIDKMIKQYKMIYHLFGSGAHHAPYAIFQRQARLFNNGKAIGLIKAADTRMAGYFKALHRMLRLKPALEATVSSLPFRDLRTLGRKKVRVNAIIQDEDFWKQVFYLLRSIFPALKVLRLADSNQPGMDKLHYLQSKESKAIERSLHWLNDVSLFPADDEVNYEGVDHQPYGDSDSEDGSEVDNVVNNHTELSDEFSDGGQENSDEEVDESEEEDESVSVGSSCVGYRILSHWNKRKKWLDSDFAIAGWMLSVCPEIMEDVKVHCTGDDRMAMECVIKHLYTGWTEDIGVVFDKFWIEWESFSNQTGKVFEQTHIWNSIHVVKGDSHLWHSIYSLP